MVRVSIARGRFKRGKGVCDTGADFAGRVQTLRCSGVVPVSAKSPDAIEALESCDQWCAWTHPAAAACVAHKGQRSFPSARKKQGVEPLWLSN